MPITPKDNEIISGTKVVKEALGAKRLQVGFLNLVVCEGSWHDMGRQYATLLKDEILEVREILKKTFVDTGDLPWDMILKDVAEPYYLAAPRRIKMFFAGLAEVTGLSVHEHVAIDQHLSVVILQRRTGPVAACTSAGAWGEVSKNGDVYFGRNFDFPVFLREQIYAKFPVFAFLNPDDGSNGIAGLGVPGMLSWNDGFNSKGVLYEVNNGCTFGSTLYMDRMQADMVLVQGLLDYDTIDEFKAYLNGVKMGFPTLLGTADQSKAQYFEIEANGRNVAPDPETGTDLTSRANQYLDKSWGIAELPDPCIWWCQTRRKTFTRMLREQAGSVDEKVFMEVMNTPLFDESNDFKANKDNGLSCFVPPTGTQEATVYQIITHTNALEAWVRFPTHGGWHHIDFKQHFKSA